MIVTTAETKSEPRQPRRLEKNRNTMRSTLVRGAGKRRCPRLLSPASMKQQARHDGQADQHAERNRQAAPADVDPGSSVRTADDEGVSRSMPPVAVTAGMPAPIPVSAVASAAEPVDQVLAHDMSQQAHLARVPVPPPP